MTAKPTRRQLNYLRALANRTGQTFTYPRTRREASREIERLKQAQPSTRIERELERKDIADAVARGPRGRHARPARRSHRLRIHRDLEGPLMTTPTVTELVRNGNRVGQRVELARYRIPAGERVLYGQRINGVVRVTDNPASGRGRAYLIERELEQDGNAALQALVHDYVEQAERHGEIPMHVPLSRYLVHVEA